MASLAVGVSITSGIAQYFFFTYSYDVIYSIRPVLVHFYGLDGRVYFDCDLTRRIIRLNSE